MSNPGLSASRALLLAVIALALVMITTLVVLGLGNSGSGSPTRHPSGSTDPGLGVAPTPRGLPSDPGPSDVAPTLGPLDTPRAGPSPTPDARKSARERSTAPEQLTGYVWPLRNALITSRFAAREFGGFLRIDGREYHDGLDLATHCGDEIRAAHDGRVLYAGRNFDVFLGYRGEPEQIYARLEQQGRVNTLPIVVVIDDGNGYRSVYVHLNKAEVEVGQVVNAGDVIGREGATGLATGCHLHYGLIRMDAGWQEVLPRLAQYGYPPQVRERIDPLKVLPWGDQYAPQRLQNRVNGTPTLTATSIPTTSASPSPTTSASPTP
jgi:murein DD-endopeptidase MepM/ murein hydrolase activator NlpD